MLRKHKQEVVGVVNHGHHRGMLVDNPTAKGGSIPVTDGVRVMGFPEERRAYRPWSITARLRREPSGRVPQGCEAR
jgi:hypothetical protein